MREIKFRVYDEQTKRMWYTHRDTPLKVKVIVGTHIYFDFGKSFVDGGRPGHIMQYTGLKDKNGKEIYEGDIFWRLLYKRSNGLYE